MIRDVGDAIAIRIKTAGVGIAGIAYPIAVRIDLVWVVSPGAVVEAS
jgi:hypothetical protein